MLDRELLDILVCPETREPVALADAELVDKVNRGITDGSIRTRSGGSPAGAITSGLLRQDGKILYPVVDDIPIMLIDEALVLED